MSTSQPNQLLALCAFVLLMNSVFAQTATAVVDTSSSTPGPEAAPDVGAIVGRVIGAVVLTLSAGLFAGLNLGLMSLDPLELELLIKSGTPKQAARAKRIAPIRARGNQLLCTLVLTNTAIYSLLPIVISDLTDGLTGFLVSTVLSVLFGEIIPQSICARHGLAIGANTVWLVKFLMVVLWPIAWPISKLLDCLLGKEIATAYSRKELTQLIDFHTEGKLAAGGDLNVDESTIIRNALKFSITHVETVMTPLPKVYSVPIDAVLDERTMVSISKAGNSRVPVVDATRGHVVGILIIKTLFLLSPSMRVPVRSIIKAMGHKVLLIEQNTPLDVMLNTFQWGRSHIAVVRKQRDLCTPQELEADAKPFHAKQTHAHTGKTVALVRDHHGLRPLRAHDRHFKSFQPTGQMYQQGDADEYHSVDSEMPEPVDPSLVQRRRVRRRVRDKVVIIEEDEDDSSSSSSSSSSTSSSSDSDEGVIKQHKNQPRFKASTLEEALKAQSRLAGPEYVSVGIVTLEDVVEELLGEEIVDETDFGINDPNAGPSPTSDALDEMMAMAYASMKWKAFAGIKPDGTIGSPHPLAAQPMPAAAAAAAIKTDSAAAPVEPPIKTRRSASLTEMDLRRHHNAFTTPKPSPKRVLRKLGAPPPTGAASTTTTTATAAPATAAAAVTTATAVAPSK